MEDNTEVLGSNGDFETVISSIIQKNIRRVVKQLLSAK
jgi:hypothetical protein